jgi:hypothetical protein
MAQKLQYEIIKSPVKNNILVSQDEIKFLFKFTSKFKMTYTEISEITNCAHFEVLMAVKMKMFVFWIVTLCRLVDRCQISPPSVIKMEGVHLSKTFIYL